MMDQINNGKKFGWPKLTCIYSLILLFIYSLIPAQTCLPGGVRFFRQGQIDSFPFNFPGCSEILGTVIIQESDAYNIQNLDSLVQINSITGNLNIYNNAGLSNLDGLIHLESINGFFQVVSNPSLTSLNGLDNLGFVGNGIYLNYNSSLKNIEGLHSLNNKLHGNLSIAANPELTSLDGLQNLSSVEGYVYVWNNLNLGSLSGLIGIDSIGEYLLIGANALLENINGLGALRFIGGDLSVFSNSKITDLTGLENLQFLDGSLSITGNTSLIDVKGFRNLEAINGSLEIRSNNGLESLDGLENIDFSSITDLTIQYSTLLSTCAVKSICDYLDHGGSSTISHNASGCNSIEEVLLGCAAISSCQVSNTNDDGLGSLRFTLECLSPGDTVFFHPGLVNAIIKLDSPIIVQKDIIIYVAPEQDIMINGSTIENTLRIEAGSNVEITNLQIVGSNGPNGVVWNLGNLMLKEVTIAGDESFGTIFSNEGELELKSGSSIQISPPTSGTLTDIDHNVYEIVEIGSQWWMVENLRTSRYNDGAKIEMISDPIAWSTSTTPGYCWYNNDSSTYEIPYGKLYNYFTVSDTNQHNVCPVGWHAPSDSEWNQLIKYVDSSADTSGMIIQSIVAGGSLKEVGTDHWLLPNTGATNLVDFTALGAGSRSPSGSYFSLKLFGTFWTSDYGRSRYLLYDSPNIFRGSYGIRHGMSVRCLKDM